MDWQGLSQWQQWALAIGGSLAAAAIIWFLRKLIANREQKDKAGTMVQQNASPVLTQNFSPTFSPTINLHASAPGRFMDAPGSISAITESVGGPEIVVDYVYAEDSKDHHDVNAPLVLRNISTAPAYNIEVLPLETVHGTVTFEPALIPYIEPSKSRNVFVNRKSGSPLFSRRLPTVLADLAASTEATTVEDVFATTVFRPRVRYKGTGPQRFETQCELHFRIWKTQVSVGPTERRIVTDSIQPFDELET